MITQISLVTKQTMKNLISINFIMWLRINFKFYPWRCWYTLKHVQVNWLFYLPCCGWLKWRVSFMGSAGIIKHPLYVGLWLPLISEEGQLIPPPLSLGRNALSQSGGWMSTEKLFLRSNSSLGLTFSIIFGTYTTLHLIFVNFPTGCSSAVTTSC